MSDEEHLIKGDIVKEAIDLYLKDSSKFEEKYIAEKLNMNEDQFYQFFKNKNEVLQYFYSDCVLQYREMARDIEGFEDATLEEKISNFIYMMFDIFQPNRKFMEKTFNSMVLIRIPASLFQKEVENVFTDIAQSENSISTLLRPFVVNPISFEVFSRQYFLLIKFWLSDTTENYEATMALVDKLVSLFTEVLQTRIPDKAMELFKYVFVDNVTKMNLPFIGRFFK
jgi:AcrR family transcriptional regulator